MIRHTAAVLSLALACGATAPGQVFAQSRVEPETSSARQLRVKAEEIGRVAETEFDRGRESAQQRAERAAFEKEKGLSFNPLSDADKAALAPPPEDAARFASFLAQPDTGLVRLLPSEKSDGKLTVRGGGAFYSFTHLVHEYRYGTSVGLEQNRLAVFPAGANYGFLFDLGEMALEEVTTETGPVKFLASFTPPAAEPEARKIQLRFHDGYQEGWFVYRQRAPAVVGHTYVMRSVEYDMSDVLVAFRVLRREEDGGVVLLWKTLKRFPVTQLERNVTRQARTR